MQKVQVIDITKSYLPGDPNAFPENLISTDREDGEEKTLPVIPMEGYNFLPTSYGYRSYFGADSTLAGDVVPNNCDQVILFQKSDYSNMMIAFTAAGVYTRAGGASAWTQTFALTDTWTASAIYKEYTWIILDNDLYIYRQGHTHVMKIAYDGTATTFVPTFLNMAGQMGIFKAHGRLGFWDSLNSVSWSSALDYTNFTPDLETLAGNCTFLEVQGRIVTIKDHGEGYVIYATKSIVGIGYNTQGTQLWDSMALTQAGGIGFTRAVVVGENNKQHFAYTSIGIFMIGHFNALSRQYDMQQIAPELFDFLKESRDPVYLDCFGGRYLHFGMLNANYLNGIVSKVDPTINPVVAVPLEQFNADTGTPFSFGSYTSESGSLWEDSNLSNNISTLVAPEGAWTMGKLAYMKNYDAPILGAAFWSAPVSTFKFDFYINELDSTAVTESSDALSIIRVLMRENGYAYWMAFRRNKTVDTYEVGFAVGDDLIQPAITIQFTGIPLSTWETFTMVRTGTNMLVARESTGEAVSFATGQPADLWPGAGNNFKRIAELYDIKAAQFPSFGPANTSKYFAFKNFLFYDEEVLGETSFFSYPTPTFTLQSGSISPAYPEILGSLVFDLQLKKWGKNLNSYRCLIALSPLNETQNQTIAFTNFGVDSGMLKYSDNTIRLFSAQPENSSLKYGKIGFYRQGFTAAQEVIVHFRMPCTGEITVEGSIDGKQLDPRLELVEFFVDEIEHTFYLDQSARWFTIAISGHFDLTYLEFRGTISGRR